jgi:hypothetical protein
LQKPQRREPGSHTGTYYWHSRLLNSNLVYNMFNNR